MARLVSAFIILLVLLLVLFFTILNGEPVTVNYYFGEVRAPLALTIILALVGGAILGLISSVVIIMSTRHEVSKLRRQIKHTEQELTNLRTMPIKDKH
ncbi:LapA family protein [Sulfuriflexus mobilis]|uniref:LapA family protein n=1 Tax=Sulfuriflexus mobilis TaxID=1811807 RepID=UPI000F83ABB3|nr:LapA family protein [Sulfuriflexus mobilis]